MAKRLRDVLSDDEIQQLTRQGAKALLAELRIRLKPAHHTTDWDDARAAEQFHPPARRGDAR